MYETLLDALQSGATVVTANNRLARTLRHAYDRRQITRGTPAWATPDIVSWSAWLRRLWEESRLRGGAAATGTLLSDSAAELLWQAAVAAAEQSAEQSEDRRSTVQLARHARQAWELLNDWQALGGEEWTQPDLSPDQKAWLRWSGSYRNRCSDAGLVDTARLCTVLTEDIDKGLFDDLPPHIFSGFDTWAPARETLLSTLIIRGVRVKIVADADSPVTQQPLIRAAPCQDSAHELRAAAAWARERLEQQPEASIGVVIPDLANRPAEVRRVFLDELLPDWRLSGRAADAPLNVSYGEPLLQVPVIAAAFNVLQLGQGRATFNDFSLWLRSRWFAGADTELAARALLDVRLREALRIEFALTTALPMCQRRAPGFAAMLQSLIAHAEQSARLSKQTGSAWAANFSELLEALGWPGHDSVDSTVWQALKSWQSLLHDFAESTRLLGPMSRGEALAILRQLAQARLFQPEGAPNGVQVMGVLEAAGHRFEHLWVCGMARELWPAAARPHPFIPIALQRRLGMPDASPAVALEYARQIAARLCSSAGELTVSWPQQLDDEALTASPFFGDMTEKAVLPVPANWNEQMLAAGRTELLSDDPPPAWPPDMPVRGGASVLNLQAVSPLNAFIEKRLGAVEMRQPPVGINALQRGNLTHQALEDFYTFAPGQAEVAALTTAERAARIRASLAKGLARLPGAGEPFMQRLAEFELQQQLHRILAFLELDERRPVFRIVECEQQHTVRVGPLILQLKLDRLDEQSDGSRLVIDYKTGQVHRQSWNPAQPRDLQLPLYVSCVVPDAAGIAFAQLSSRGIGYDGVGDEAIAASIPGMRSPGRKSGTEVKYQYPFSNQLIESWDELRGAWDKQLAELAERFAAGDFRLDPRNPDSARRQFAVLSRIYDSGIGVLEDEA